MKTLRTWLLASLAAATAAAAGQARATPGELGSFGSRVNIAPGGFTLKDGGPGSISASRSFVISGDNGVVGAGAASLANGALHSNAFATHVLCEGSDLNPCQSSGVATSAAFWDTVVFTDGDGPRQSAALIPLSITIDGELDGETKGARMRSYYGYDTNIDPDTLAWVDIGSGQTEIDDTLFIPVDDNPLFLYVEIYTYAATTGALSTTARADFGNTLHFNWVLPDDMTATSASGVFLTDLSAAPEPAAWALMLAGFGAAGATLRARRRRLA